MLLQRAQASPSRVSPNKLSMRTTGGAETGTVGISIEIESALRLKNPAQGHEPPNAFIVLHWELGEQPLELMTEVIYKSSYPAWHEKKEAALVLSQSNIDRIMNDRL